LRRLALEMVKLNKTDEMVMSSLKECKEGLTLAEISEKTGEPSKKVFRSLRKLFEKEMITCGSHKYRPSDT